MSSAGQGAAGRTCCCLTWGGGRQGCIVGFRPSQFEQPYPAATLPSRFCPPARRSIAADETLSLQELLRSVKAELLLKDAAIRALNRENAQRAERLLALQAHVDALSQQVAAAQQQPSSSHSGGSQARAALAYAQHLWASPLTAATLATPGAAISSASSSLASGERGGGMPQPVSPVAGLFASPATSFIPLPTSQQHPATSATSSPASSSSRVPGGSPARSGAGAAPAAPSPQLHASPATMSALAAGLSDQRLSYLLELVVQKRLSAAQAQQVGAEEVGWD